MIDGGLRKLFRQYLAPRGWDLQAIETGGTGLGIPDSNLCHPDCGEIWIEYKHTTANAVSIRAEQVAWAERRIRHGGRVFLAVRRRNAPTRADELHLFNSIDTRFVSDGGLRAATPLVRTNGGPSRWHWDEIDSALKSLHSTDPAL